jgi:hypothetical protein
MYNERRLGRMRDAECDSDFRVLQTKVRLQEPLVLPSPDRYRQPVIVEQKIVIFADKETEQTTQ